MRKIGLLLVSIILSFSLIGISNPGIVTTINASLRTALSQSPSPPESPVPADGENGVPVDTDDDDSVNLQATVNDADSITLTVRFYGRPFCEIPNFTLVALPDTQKYSLSYPDIFNAQTSWIVANRDESNIAFVTHLGDIVENAGVIAQWLNADTAIDFLDVSPPIPYGLAVGNTDTSPMGNPDNTTQFNTYFGISRFSGKPFYGGHYGTDNDNNYELFSSGGIDFIIIHLQYNPEPDPLVLEWADDLLADTNASRRAIIVFHDLVESTTALSASGQVVYDYLKHNPNLFLMLGGHLDTEITLTLTDSGHTVYALRSDFQTRANGGNGWLRLMEFQPAADQIQVYTYSPYTNQWENDANSKFTLPYTVCEFQLIDTELDVEPGTSPSVKWKHRDFNTSYQWYVTVSDDTNTVIGPTWSFTTTAPTAADLVDFNVTSIPHAIQLGWQTAQEVDLLGFNIFRSVAVDGLPVKINPAMIPGINPGQLKGNSYQFLDVTAESGKTYNYWVEWVGEAGSMQFGPVTGSLPIYTWLPLGFK